MTRDTKNGAAQSNDGAESETPADAAEPLDRESEDEQAEADAERDLSALSAEELIDHLREAKADHVQMKDALLRARAEVENIRRRSQNEIVAARKFAIEGFAQELLSVRDSLESASVVEINAGASAGEAVRQMKEGIGLTLKQFGIVLAKFAITEVEAGPGVRFDPQRHQAISMAPSDEVEDGHIVTVVQKGFLLKDRLLRAAMVVVAKKA